MISIDAKGKKIGRVASQAASILMGKHSVKFAKNSVIDEKVTIENVNNLDISAKKKVSDTYVTYTGHRGGLNNEKLGELMRRRGLNEVMKRAILRMLPNNKLRTKRMKNLIIR